MEDEYYKLIGIDNLEVEDYEHPVKVELFLKNNPKTIADFLDMRINVYEAGTTDLINITSSKVEFNTNHLKD